MVADGAKHDSKRVDPGILLGTALPKARAPGLRAHRFRSVRHPQHFQHEILKKEASIGRALTGVRIARPFHQAQLQKRICLRSTGRAGNECMVDFEGHLRVNLPTILEH